MIDYRFYQKNSPLRLSQIAKELSLDVVFKGKDDILIHGVAALGEARHEDLAFCISSKGKDIATQAGACLVLPEDLEKLPKDVIGFPTNSPRADFAEIAKLLISPIGNNIYENREPNSTNSNVEIGAIIHETAIIAASASVGKGSFIGPNCVIGEGVHIGRNCHIAANCVIEFALIGDNVRIGANSVIGKSGFGVVPGKNGLIEIPHFGRVIIQDNVTIGALCTIDKGALGDTIIGLGTKIDNHCHFAHNVKIGNGVVIAAFAGISGSAQIGDFVMMAGRVGIADHVKIGNGAKLAAAAVVLNDLPGGETYGGFPAKPRMKWLRETAKLAKLTQTK